MNAPAPETHHPAPAATNDDTSYDQARLVEVLESLETQIKKQTSLKFAFLRGVVYGLGTVIGATLLLALFGGILASVINSLGGLPLIGDFINEEAVDNYLDDTSQPNSLE